MRAVVEADADDLPRPGDRGQQLHSLHRHSLVALHRLDLGEQTSLEDRLQRAVVGTDVRERLSPDVVDAPVAEQRRAGMAARLEAHQSHGGAAYA
jgi:hypothetical protein